MNTQTKSIKSSGIDGTARSGKHRKQFKAGSRSKHQEVTETQFLRRMTRWFETVTKCRADARNIGERHTETPGKHTPYRSTHQDGKGAPPGANGKAKRHEIKDPEKYSKEEHNDKHT